MRAGKLFFCAIVHTTLICAHSSNIEDKLASFSEGKRFLGTGDEECEYVQQSDQMDNYGKLKELREELVNYYSIVEKLIETRAEENEFFHLLENINRIKAELVDIEERVRDEQVSMASSDSDNFGIWNHDEITISQLVMEYGSQEYIYVIPPDISTMKVDIHSSLMIPRESWSTLLDVILKNNGIGVKNINAYTKALYTLKTDFATVSCITSRRCELDGLDTKARVIHIFSPPVENLRSAFYFLERFKDVKSMFVYQVGQKIAIVGFQEDVKKLLIMCENVWEADQQKITKVIITTKITPEEAINVLKNFFGPLSDNSRSISLAKSGPDLSVVPLKGDRGVILVGGEKTVEQALHIIKNIEGQIENPHDLTCFWYTCSHTPPSDMAELLENVYTSLIFSTISDAKNNTVTRTSDIPLLDMGFDNDQPSHHQSIQKQKRDSNSPLSSKGYDAEHGDIKEDSRMSELSDKEEKSSKQIHFFPYNSTGSVLMIVRKDLLPKIKEVVQKLDVPKRMVELEVLLCERRINNSTRSGINLLKFGSGSSKTNHTGFSYDRTSVAPTKGLLEFFTSLPKTKYFPAFDATYNFLLSQDDVKITASPSVVAINQTTAIISVTDQISINNGASPVNTSNGSVFFKDSYERADFGITLKLTPTVHEMELDSEGGGLYVTMDNDIAFETIKHTAESEKSRPDVHKRIIKNQVRIPDGETIILGGLRQKAIDEKNEKIPFLGEIPGIGKLFGTTVLSDKSTEMFIFIKPKVIKDPRLDLKAILNEKLKIRPGETEEFLQKIKDGGVRKKRKLFSDSFNLFFGDNFSQSNPGCNFS